MTITLLTIALALRAAAIGHEPLWGETPQTFAFGVVHPEIRLSYENDYLLLSGSHRIANPDGVRRARFDSQLALQYAPQTTLNLKLEIPYGEVWNQQKVGGAVARSSACGIGDLVFSAKSRFGERFGPTWKIHQAAMLGIKLPTGAAGGRLPDGNRMSPSDLPGTGKWGIQAGYAYGYERLQDTTWLAASYMRDFGGSGARGDMWTLDASYGYWTHRPTRAEELGFLLAAGPHLEVNGKDRISSGNDPDSGFTMVGFQTTFIATQGRSQARIGVLVPLYQHVNGLQVRPELILRAGAEMFF